MHVYGDNNALTINSFNMGFANATGRTAIILEGSNNSITANAAFRLVGGTGTSVDGIRGASINYVADSSGVSAINVASPASAGATVLTGVITLDLSDFIFDSDTADFHLISTTNSFMNAEILNWLNLIDGGSDLFAVYYNGTRLDDSAWTLSGGADGLWVNVDGTFVPEPSTYAAIFGALCLGFAAYRRRK